MRASLPTPRPLLTSARRWNELAAELGTDQRGERLALRRIDAAFRSVLGLDPRPYELDGDGNDGDWQLSYGGDPLTSGQEDDVRRYIEFVRSSAG